MYTKSSYTQIKSINKIKKKKKDRENFHSKDTSRLKRFSFQTINKIKVDEQSKSKSKNKVLSVF